MDIPVFKGFDYEPNDVEDEMFLSEVPLTLLQENIRSQFLDPGENRKTDFVQSFLNKYIYTKENDLEEEDSEIEELHDTFIKFMEDILHEQLSIGIPNLDQMSNEEQEEIVHYIYRFFIINIKKNFVKFCLNYIKDNKGKIYDELPKKKDVAYLSYKKVIDDEEDLLIISNISTVVQDIFGKEFTIDDLFNAIGADGDSHLELDFIMAKYDSFDITGNFMDDYMKLVSSDETLLYEITCKVKNKMLNKYTK